MQPLTSAPIIVRFLALAGILSVGTAQAQPAGDSVEQVPAGDFTFARPLGEGPVYRVRIAGLIDAALASYVDRALADAGSAGASVVLLEVNTFGGLIEAADQIRSAILETETPTVAYVNHNAASAGALIAYAADRIAMAPGSSIGAATAVDAAGEYASEKVQSYVRSLMRATAEANGRDPRIAEAMVDERIEIPGVKEPGRLLSLSASEAVRLGVADAEIGTEDELLMAIGAEGPVVAHAASRTERLLRFLGTPVVASLLLLMMMGGLYFELQSPGFGFAGAIALLGAFLFFAPHYLLGLVESWEIILFLVGVTLLVVEIFVTPGFGLFGIAGLVLAFSALGAALVGNVGFSFPGVSHLTGAAVTLASALALTIVAGLTLGRYLPESTRFQRLVLGTSLRGDEGYTSAETDDALVGQRGRAVSPLRPAGAADIGGRRIDVVSQGGFIAAGASVEVVRARGARVEVREVSDER